MLNASVCQPEWRESTLVADIKARYIWSSAMLEEAFQSKLRMWKEAMIAPSGSILFGHDSAHDQCNRNSPFTVSHSLLEAV